jgi:hypothetical protein
MTNHYSTGKSEIAKANHQFGFVEFLRSGAYVKVSDIANLFPGKRIDNWMRLKSTKELLIAFTAEPAYGGASPVRTVVGRMSAPSDPREHSKASTGRQLVEQGTWVHPDIAIQFAQWCSPAFALWVSRQIRHLLEYGEVNLHYQKWTKDEHLEGVALNRDDITDMYGSQ